MVELKEQVVQVFVLVPGCFQLVEVRRDIAHFVEILRSDLTYVQVNQVAVVSIYFEELFFSQVFNIEEPLNVDVLVRENH